MKINSSIFGLNPRIFGFHRSVQCLMLVEVPDPRGSEIDRCPAQSEKIGLPESTTLFEDRVFQHESRSQTV